MKTQDMERVIYKKGEMCAQTVTYIDKEGIERCSCTSHYLNMGQDLTVEEYLAKNPDYVLMSWDEFLPMLNTMQDEAYLKPFKEITEEQYYESLECLPPQKWETVDGVNIFRMSEYLTGNITDHLVSYNGKYYSANRRTSTPYSEIAKEIKSL